MNRSILAGIPYSPLRARNAAVAGIALLAFSGQAFANTVVLPPLVSNGASPKVVANIHQLMSSELEFMNEVNGVREVDSPPASLDAACVTNDACLRGIATTHGGDAVLTGVVTAQPGTLVLDLVFFSGGRIARRQAYTVPDDATTLANKMTGMLKEMVAGAPPAAQVAAAAPSASTFSSALDDDDFMASPTPAPAARPAPAANPFALNDGLVDAGPTPEEMARQQAEQEARMRAEQEARMRAEQEARMRAEQDARMRAEQEARRRSEEEARMRAEQEARARAEQEARARAEEEGRRLAAEAEVARKRAENERLRQEEAARRAAEEQARMQAAAAATPPAPAMISFANSSDKITAEQIDSVVQFGAPNAAPTTAYTPTSYTPPPAAYTPPPAAYTPPPAAYTPPATSYAAAPTYAPPAQAYVAPAPAYGQPAPYGQGTSGYGQPASAYGQPAPAYGQPAARGSSDASLAMEEQELAALENPGMLDLDSDSKKGRERGASSGSAATLERATPKTLQLSVRAGYSKYYAFDFITAGVEVGVPITKGLMAVAGVEAYSVQRELPPEFQTPGQPIFEWNTIYPINAGLAYKFKTGTIVVPYVGADAIFVQYYKDDIGADWAGGARARAGIDVMLAKNFGLNANVAVGGWSGKNWTLIDATLGNSGILPQINGGTVLAF